MDTRLPPVPLRYTSPALPFTGGNRLPRIPHLLMVLLLTLAAWALRASYPPDAFVDDPPYHLLRVQKLLDSPPSPRDPDPMTAWPRGEVAPWAWGFDWVVAGMAWARLGGGPASPEAVEAACAPVIPLLGASAVPLAWALGLALGWRRRALAAAALVAILPIHVLYSAAGRVDHHVVEPLFVGLATLGPAWIAGRGMGPGLRRGLLLGVSGLASSLSLAFAPAAAATGPGAAAVLGVWLATRRDGSEKVFVAAAAVGAVAALAASPDPSGWSFFCPSLLTLTAFALIAAGALAVGVLARRGRSLPVAVGGGALVALALATVAALLAPEARTQVARAFGYVIHPLGLVDSEEAVPFWRSPAQFLALASWLAVLAPVGLASWLAPRKAATHAGLAVLAAALLLLGALQVRFLVAAVPLLVLASVEGAGVLWGVVRALLTRARVRPPVAAVAGAAVVVIALQPSVLLLPELVERGPWRGALEDVSARIASRPRADGGILTLPAIGHFLKFHARVPTVCDNLWGVPEADRAVLACYELLYERDPARAARLLDESRVRFIVLPPPAPAQVRRDSVALGRDPDELVGPDGRFRPAFAATLWGRLGTWSQGAALGEVGPFGARLLGDVDVVAADGSPVVQLRLFER